MRSEKEPGMPPHDARPAAPLTAAPLTPRGRGAVATLGLRGELDRIDEQFTAANGLSAAEQELDRICYGHWGGAAAEDVVYVRSGERAAELHCHGGAAAVERILSGIRQAGGEVIDAETFCREEFSAVEAECLHALLRATTQRTAHHLLRQCTLFPEALRSLQTASGEQRRAAVQRLLRWSEFGIRLTRPWKGVLCGRPNVGKSSLINALVGYRRSVVFDQPGTTRDVVSVETSLDGWPVEFSDTAGLRETEAGLEAEGIVRARKRLEQADQVIVVLDAAEGLTPGDERLLTDFPDALAVWNKSDLASTGFESPVEGALLVSALTGTGMEELIRRLVRRLVPHEPPPDAPFPVTAAQRDELVRLRDPDRQGRFQHVPEGGEEGVGGGGGDAARG